MVYTHIIRPQKGMKLIRVIVQMCLGNRMASESQTSHTTGCLIPSTPDVQDKLIHTDRKQMSGYKGQGEGEWGVMFNGNRVSTWDDKKVLEMDRGRGCTAL